MKAIEYYDFQFQHRINLQEYLEKFYSLQFTQSGDKYVCSSDPDLSIHRNGVYENTWVRASIPVGDKNKFGVYLKYGTVINWESIAHDCSISEALAIVKKNRRKLPDYKTVRYKKLESMFSRAATRFRYSRLQVVEDYLEKRGIDHTSYAKDFNIGSPKSYGTLVVDLINPRLHEKEVRDLLDDLFIAQPPAHYPYLPFVPSVIVPVHNQAGDFIGYHGRRVDPGNEQRYYNTGFLRERAKEILFGEDKRGINDAIVKKRQLVLTKGIFDFFTCYQNNHKQVLATLDKGISVAQFDRVMKMPVDEIVVGFEDDKERSIIAGLMHSNLKKINLKIPKGSKDLDETVLKSGQSIDDIIEAAILSAPVTQEEIRRAAIKQRNDNLQILFGKGQKFLIRQDKLLDEISSSKHAPDKLKNFIREKAAENIKILPWGTKYVEFTQTFVQEPVLGQFKAELRMLLFLMAKTPHKAGKIPYTNGKLQNALDLTETVMIEYRKRLIESGYLLTEKIISGSGKSRKAHTDYYPSTIKFILGPPNDSEKN